MKNKNIFQRLYKEYQRNGVSGVLYKVSENEYLPSWLCHFSKSNLYIYEGNEKKYDYRDKLTNYDFFRATKSDIKSILVLSGFKDRDMSAPTKRLTAFFDNGNSCYSIKFENNIIAYLMLYKGEYMLTRDDYRSINLNITLDENILFFGYGFIDSKYRMRGLFPYMMDYAMSGNENATYITDIADQNIHSHRSHLKLGFKTIYSLVALKIFSKRLTVWKLFGGDSVYISKKTGFRISGSQTDSGVCVEVESGVRVSPSKQSLLYK